MTRKRLLSSLVLMAGVNLGSCVLPPTPQSAFEPNATVQLAPADPGGTLRIAAVGDAGDTPKEVADAIRRLHGEKALDAILILGDNFYPCGVRSETDPQWKIIDDFNAVGVPIYPVLGNHDYGRAKQKLGRVWAFCHHRVDPGAQIRFTATDPGQGKINRWSFPSRSYSIVTPQAEIFMVDTTPVAEGWQGVAGGKSGDRIVEELGEALRTTGDSVPWRIVAGHHVIFSSGSEHGVPCDRGCVRLRERLNGLLDGGKVDVYLSGHDHDLELIEQASPSRWYVVSGAGSPPKIRGLLLRPSSEPPTLFPTIPSQGFPGFALFEITRDSLAVTFYGIDGAPSQRIDAPCGTGRHPMGTYKFPLVEVSPDSVSTEGETGFSAGAFHAQSTYWGVGPNDTVRLDEMDFDEDTVEIELEGVDRTDGNDTVIKFVNIRTLDDFRKAADRAFAHMPLQDEHPDWPPEAKKAIAERRLMKGMSKRQVFYVLGSPEGVRESEEKGQKVEVWTIRQNKGMQIGFWTVSAGAPATGLPKTLRFIDGKLEDFEAGGGGVNLDD